MSNSLRDYVRFVLLEGSRDAGMTTAKWWAQKGVTYKGSQADKPYFVLTDPSGNEVTGDVTFPGDPYTYRSLGSGKLQVVSGPTQKSIGASFSRSQEPKKKDVDSSKESPESEESEAEPDRKKQAAVLILNGIGNVFKAMSGMWDMKERWLSNFKTVGPETALFIQGGGMGGYTDGLADGLASLKLGIDVILRGGGVEQAVNALKVVIQPVPDPILNIETVAGSNSFRSKLGLAKARFNQAAILLKQSEKEKTSQEAKGLLETAAGMSALASKEISDENTRSFMAKGALVSKDGLTYSRIVTGGSLPSIGRYAKSDVDRIAGMLLDDEVSSDSKFPGVP